ncbi:hypothetical protein PMAYCL1PPCAC_22345, partial [Pristionchus mayeri]
WTLLAPMNERKCGASAAVLNRHIYVVGGGTNDELSLSLERYDPVTNTWTTLKPMTRGRVCAEFVDSCGKLFLLGGYDSMLVKNDESISSVEMYDPVTDDWEEITDMP